MFQNFLWNPKYISARDNYNSHSQHRTHMWSKQHKRTAQFSKKVWKRNTVNFTKWLNIPIITLKRSGFWGNLHARGPLSAFTYKCIRYSNFEPRSVSYFEAWVGSHHCVNDGCHVRVYSEWQSCKEYATLFCYYLNINVIDKALMVVKYGINLISDVIKLYMRVEYLNTQVTK